MILRRVRLSPQSCRSLVLCDGECITMMTMTLDINRPIIVQHRVNGTSAPNRPTNRQQPTTTATALDRTDRPALAVYVLWMTTTMMVNMVGMHRIRRCDNRQPHHGRMRMSLASMSTASVMSTIEASTFTVWCRPRRLRKVVGCSR